MEDKGADHPPDVINIQLPESGGAQAEVQKRATILEQAVLDGQRGELPGDESEWRGVPRARSPGQENFQEKCSRWLECSSSSVISSDDISSICSEYTSATDEVLKISNINLNFSGDKVTKKFGDQKLVHKAGKDINENQILQIMEGSNNIQTFNNVQVIGSKNVHVGNITVVQYISSSGKKSYDESKEGSNAHKLIRDEVIEPAGKIFRIVDRNGWLAQPAMDTLDDLETPVPYVIICHTATDSGKTQAENVLLIRNIQTFHIESRNWDDIGYNFLIGCDGLVYEGRGWNYVGAHTYGWNSKSIAISFVGCFIKTIPPEKSLEMCRQLIKLGVELGKIDKDYKLLGHCQCQPIESPGRLLYAEIQKWDNWSQEQQVER